jgi:hypothetical protein
LVSPRNLLLVHLVRSASHNNNNNNSNHSSRLQTPSAPLVNSHSRNRHNNRLGDFLALARLAPTSRDSEEALLVRLNFCFGALNSYIY